MPAIEIPSSPLVRTGMPVRINYRDHGSGRPVVVLHGGWGYEMYSFDRQIAALERTCRIVIPDRSGYGGSASIDDLPPDFHRRAAAETRSVIDALGLAAPVLWGHSDGAIIALLVALAFPGRTSGVILEATHLYKHKPSSRAFFERVATDPLTIGARAAAALLRDHGERWRQIVQMHSRAWLRIGAEARSPVDDFYGGRLSELTVPALLVHGARDPRTEPGELRALCDALGAPHESVHRAFRIFADGEHSPHSERADADAVSDAALQFLRMLEARPAHPADPAHAADRAHSADPADPAHPAHPADSAHPADPADPAHPAHPADPAHPAHRHD